MDEIKPQGQEAVIYCRVSSASQMARGHGIVSQETRCREFARMKGYIVREVFRDEAVSGSLIQRPGMLKLLAHVGEYKTQGECVVIIDDISRLARDIKAHLDLRSAITEAGGRLESPSIEFGEDCDSILVENLLASVSQHQRQKIMEQNYNRKRARLLNGYWAFSYPPGYRYEARKGEGKVLVREEPLASIIAEGLEGFASGRFQTQAEVKRFFESFPAFPKTRHGTVTNENVNRILTRVIYAGYLEHPDWGVSLRPAKHPALISLATYERIQERLSEKAKVPARANIDEHFPLRGFVLCGDCDNSLTACWSKSKTGKKHPYYMCFNKGCESKGKSIPRAKLEGAFEETLAAIEPAPVMADMLKVMVAKAWTYKQDRAAMLRRSINAKLAETEKQVTALLDRVVEATSKAVVSRYESRIAELERESLILQEKLDTEAAPTDTQRDKFELALRFFSNPCHLWDNGGLEGKRTVMKLAFEERLVYCRNEGLRTPKTTLPFKVLGGEHGPFELMAEGMGLTSNLLWAGNELKSLSSTRAPRDPSAIGMTLDGGADAVDSHHLIW